MQVDGVPYTGGTIAICFFFFWCPEADEFLTVNKVPVIVKEHITYYVGQSL